MSVLHACSRLAFEDCGIPMREASQYFIEEMTSNQRHNLQGLFSQAISTVADKVEKYSSNEGQPGILFMKEIPFLTRRDW
ncbi:hypothetical protein RRG08_015505 [Elysia crispata]|uniref:Uncharacterized protein n=1 Tax=Elysia crispata TaxID=231223 RepID=A0AAE1ADP2_9GAST|nr:hypothetical protein RRG08_015505 [Elysia crispata]